MIPFAVDANAIHAFQRERIEQIHGVAQTAIYSILTENCIALDNERLCLQEWIECAGGKFPLALTDWIADQAAVGKVRFFDLSSSDCGQILRREGLPRKDHKWVRLAIGSAGRKIVSGDIDFFDPRQKNASARVKDNLRANRRGPLLRVLKRQFRVDVMCLEHVPDELEQLDA